MARPRKPRVLVKCVANTYTQPHERIIEVSFPERTDIGQMPGCLIRLNNSTPPHKPRVEVYRTDGEVDVIAPRRKFWACWVRPDGASESEITLHRTEREALENIAEALEVPLNDPDDPQQVRSDEELYTALNDAMNEQNKGEWDIEEVDEP